MPTAYVLLNTEIGSESEVLEALKKVEGVGEVHNPWGVCDIIASIKADTMDRLTSIITEKSRKSEVNANLTIFITETQSPPILFGT